MTLEELRRHFAAAAPVAAAIPGDEGPRSAPALLKPASVLVPIVARRDELTLLLTRRAAHLKDHSGQVSFPGGRVAAEDPSPEATALREAREEIGLALAPAAILGRLDDYPTRSGYVITPLVVWAERDADLQPNPAEVAAIHRVPFADLDRPGAPEFVAIAESERPVIRYPLLGTTLHAPTAALLYQFVEVALHGRPTRVAHLEQPTWAWR